MCSNIKLFHSPTQKIQNSLWESKGISVFIKRDDLLNVASASGNKVRKLKYNLLAAREQGCHTLITVGGAFSNHIDAVAAIGSTLEFKTIGLIRGEDDPDNPTLRQVRNRGMTLHFLPRHLYRQRTSKEFWETWKELYPGAFIVHEGGSNAYAMAGIKEMCNEIQRDLHVRPDHYFCAVGTGGTIAGIAAATHPECRITGVLAGKGIGFRRSVDLNLDNLNCPRQKISLNDNYHFGGFGKYDPQLMEYILEFLKSHGILLDPLYTSKMMLCLENNIADDKFTAGSKIVAIHTGGLQGWAGYRYRNGSTAVMRDIFTLLRKLL